MTVSKDERLHIRIPSDLKKDGVIAAEVRRWNLTQLIIDLLRTDVEALKANNAEAFKDAARRLAENRDRNGQTRTVAVTHEKANKDDIRPARIQNAQRHRASGGRRKR